MNWYKLSQQSLLFYPWATPPHEATQPQPPYYTDPKTGKDIYICTRCGNEIAKEDTEWYRGIEEKKEKLQLPKINQQQLTTGVVEITQYLAPFLQQLDQYIQEKDLESKRNDLYDYGYSTALHSWEVQVPHLANIVNKYPFLKDLCNYSSRSWWRTGFCYLIKNTPIEIDGKALNDLREIINNPSPIIEEFMQYSSQEFEVDYIVPICEECYEKFDKCEFCNNIISPGARKWTTTWDDTGYVCEKCVDDGRADICIECGKADPQEDMTYLEDEGFICSDCYKERSSQATEWAENALSELNIPVGKNLPISRKTLEATFQFLKRYADKYGYNAYLSDDNEFSRLLHLAKKARLTESAIDYISHFASQGDNLDTALAQVENNIEAQDYMTSQYPSLSQYKDLPFNIEVEDNYLEEIPGFTLTITPSKEFFNYARRRYPNIDSVWKEMKRTPHHSGALAYARCAYDGRNTLVINNLQRDADYDNFMSVAYAPMKEQQETAKWLDNTTKHWDVFLLNVIRAMAKANDINAYLTTFDQQKQKWGRLPIHKSKRTYETVPEQMGFPLEDISTPELIEREVGGYGEPLYQVAEDNMKNNWYKKAKEKCLKLS